MNFIKKAVDGKVDELTHMQFQKFSKGLFKDRAVIKAKKVDEKITINTTNEFANELVKIVAEELDDKRIMVTGILVSTSDLKGKLDFKEKKQFQGIGKYVIEKEMSGKEILSLLNNFPKVFFGLSFKSDKSELKIKSKLPKSGKPGSKNEEMPTPDFCKLITNRKEIGDSFVFEKPDFKEAEIKHDFIIESINVPASLKGSEDYAKIREQSKRKGKIIRTGSIDGQKFSKEYNFEA